LDWSPELWIACHDDDEQNARLARHAWEDNGLDIPETYLDVLIGYLGESGCSAPKADLSNFRKIMRMSTFVQVWQLRLAKV
jgi:hypothetical protein